MSNIKIEIFHFKESFLNVLKNSFFLLLVLNFLGLLLSKLACFPLILFVYYNTGFDCLFFFFPFSSFPLPFTSVSTFFCLISVFCSNLSLVLFSHFFSEHLHLSHQLLFSQYLSLTSFLSACGSCLESSPVLCLYKDSCQNIETVFQLFHSNIFIV